MRVDFIPHWLVSPNEGLGGISPIEAMERGEGGRVWRLRVSLGIGDSPLAIRHVKWNNHGAFQVRSVADNAATANGAITLGEVSKESGGGNRTYRRPQSFP